MPARLSTIFAHCPSLRPHEPLDDLRAGPALGARWQRMQLWSRETSSWTWVPGRATSAWQSSGGSIRPGHQCGLQSAHAVRCARERYTRWLRQMPYVAFRRGTIRCGRLGFPGAQCQRSRSALAEMKRVMKPGGRLVVLDTTRPRRNILLPFIRFYLRA